VVNVLLSVLSVILVWRLGRAVFDDPRVALGAAWIFAFEPVSVAYSVTLVSETLFLVLFLLSLERLAVFLRERRLQALAMAGLWLAAATFVRPVTYYLPIALAAGLFFVLARDSGLRWKAPAVLLICVLPWLAAWQMRNWFETGYSRFSSAAEMNIYLNVAADVTAHVEHRPFLDVSKEMGYLGAANPSEQDYLFQPYLARHPEQTGWSQGQRLAFMHSEAARMIQAHPVVYAHASLMSLFELLFTPGAGNFDRLMTQQSSMRISGLRNEGALRWGIVIIKTQPWDAVEKALFEVVVLGLYLLAARGIFRCEVHRPGLWLLLGTSLYFLILTAAVTGPGLDVRLRLPIMPAVCILAAEGFQRRTAGAMEICRHRRGGALMRIVHILKGKANPDTPNGVNRVVHWMAASELRLGHEVEVWGLAESMTPPPHSRENRSELAKNWLCKLLAEKCRRKTRIARQGVA
jgi:hypothetical protein